MRHRGAAPLAGQPKIMSLFSGGGDGSMHSLDFSAVQDRCIREREAAFGPGEDGRQAAVRRQRQRAVNLIFGGGSDDLAVDRKEVRLTCPIRKSRMDIPVRGPKCRHVEAFDLQTFFSFAEQSKSRRDPSCECPVCRCLIRASEVEIDWWLHSELERFPDASKITLFADGSTMKADHLANTESMIEINDTQLSQAAQFPLLAVKPEPSSTPSRRRELDASYGPSEDANERHQMPRVQPSPPEEACASGEDGRSYVTASGIAVSFEPLPTQSLTHAVGPPGAASQISSSSHYSQSMTGRAPVSQYRIGVPWCATCGGRATLAAASAAGEGLVSCVCGRIGPADWPRCWPCGGSQDGSLTGSLVVVMEMPSCGGSEEEIVVRLTSAWTAGGSAIAYLAATLCGGGLFIQATAACWVCSVALSTAEKHFLQAVVRDAVALRAAGLEGRDVPTKSLPTADFRLVPPRFQKVKSGTARAA